MYNLTTRSYIVTLLFFVSVYVMKWLGIDVHHYGFWIILTPYLILFALIFKNIYDRRNEKNIKQFLTFKVNELLLVGVFLLVALSFFFFVVVRL